MIEALEQIAIEAGVEIMRLAAQPIIATTKADGSRRTNLDVASEQIILKRLAEQFQHIPIISEEAVDDGHYEEDLQSAFFLVDPLDGTRELSKGFGEFCVNIALVDSGRPRLGVVFAPAENRIYSIRNGGAARALVSSGGKIESWEAIHPRPHPNGQRGIVSRSRSDDAVAYLNRRDISDIVFTGSTLKFCRVAEGYADIYPSVGDTHEWDTAAGDAILAAAGGQTVTLTDGLPLTYGKIQGARPFLNPPYVASGGPREHKA